MWSVVGFVMMSKPHKGRREKGGGGAHKTCMTSFRLSLLSLKHPAFCKHKENIKNLINSFTHLPFHITFLLSFLVSSWASVPPLVKYKVLHLSRNSGHKLCSTHLSHTDAEKCVFSVQSKQGIGFIALHAFCSCPVSSHTSACLHRL